MKVDLIWATEHGDELASRIARVSNPSNQNNKETAHKLLKHLIKQGHWSPFEMINMCVGIETTRDIGRQILRHRSFSFQEFSQRYQNITELPQAPLRELRLQDSKNRQSSIPVEDVALKAFWDSAQREIYDITMKIYQNALKKGIAKEQARAILPEGLTSTRIYMNGTVRSWIHFLRSRLEPGAQKEIRDIANEVANILSVTFPSMYDVVEDYIYGGQL